MLTSFSKAVNHAKYYPFDDVSSRYEIFCIDAR